MDVDQGDGAVLISPLGKIVFFDASHDNCARELRITHISPSPLSSTHIAAFSPRQPSVRTSARVPRPPLGPEANPQPQSTSAVLGSDSEFPVRSVCNGLPPVCVLLAGPP